MKRAMVVAAAALIAVSAVADGSPYMGGSGGRTGGYVGSDGRQVGTNDGGVITTSGGRGGGVLVGGNSAYMGSGNSAYIGSGNRGDSPMLGGGGSRGGKKRVGTRFAG